MGRVCAFIIVIIRTSNMCYKKLQTPSARCCRSMRYLRRRILIRYRFACFRGHRCRRLSSVFSIAQELLRAARDRPDNLEAQREDVMDRIDIEEEEEEEEGEGEDDEMSDKELLANELELVRIKEHVRPSPGRNCVIFSIILRCSARRSIVCRDTCNLNSCCLQTSRDRTKRAHCSWQESRLSFA